MTHATPPTPDFPPEWLAGYADGELDSVQRAAVETWLVATPGAEVVVRHHERLATGLTKLFAEAPLPLVDAASWDAMMLAARQRAERPTPAPTPPVRRTRWVSVANALATMAATVGLMYLVSDRPLPVTPAVEAAFPVALATDVSVLSIYDADASQLVVGEPPLSREPLQMVNDRQVTIEADPVATDQKPSPPNPMIVPPVHSQPVP